MLAGSGHGPTGGPSNFSAAVWFVAAAALTTSYCGGKRSVWARHSNKVVVLVQGNGQPWNYAAHWAKHEIKDQGEPATR